MKRLMGMITLLTFIQTYGQTPAALQKAAWITAPDTLACPVFEKVIKIKQTVKTATLTITSHGIYEAQLNGKKIGDAYFTPGWTNYNKRLQYRAYNLSRQLHPGKNELQFTLSGGWYSGLFGEEMKTNLYGKGSAMLCSLTITYNDGSKQVVNSDSTWHCGSGPVRYADFYNGEIQDTRIVSSEWSVVTVMPPNNVKLVPQTAPPVTAQEVFKPKKIRQNTNGETLIDFGQNLAGFVRLAVKGKTGDTLKISHAELLDTAGNLYTGNLRDAKATDVYILNGKMQVLQPHFTYHGFRYAKLEYIRNGKIIAPPSWGWGAVAIAIHNQLKPAGTFSCSNPMINQLQHNITWSMNSNFVDIPTDCPQRSERFGWTGDAQVFCATAAYNRDVKAFYSKYLASLRDDQGTNGAVPVIIPDLEQPKDTLKQGYAGWGDAATIMPWTLYEVYGDKQLLAKQYAGMKAWVDYITSQCQNSLWQANGYGDWYAMGDKTSLPLIDQCFYYHSTQLLINAAKLLGKTADIEIYTALAAQIRTAFREAYHFDTQCTRTQTAYVLALHFDLLSENQRQAAADSLVKRIHENKDHLATGFLGTPYLLSVLTKYGYTKLAYTLLLQQSCPSWLYPITKGATTMWERWDATKPDGTIQQCSFNHYAYGAVGQWLYEDMAGIKAESPGYQTILIAPHPDKRVRWVKASYKCSYGKIVSEWQFKGNHIDYHVTIPGHTTATIELPGQIVKKLKAGDYHFIIKA
jgi:alpha-L-rhamnosidase